MRIYGDGMSSVKNTPENKTRCIANIYSRIYRDDAMPEQCSRKRGHGDDGLLCTQHAKLMASERGFVSIPDDEEPNNGE